MAVARGGNIGTVNFAVKHPTGIALPPTDFSLALPLRIVNENGAAALGMMLLPKSAFTAIEPVPARGDENSRRPTTATGKELVHEAVEHAFPVQLSA